MKHHWLQYYVDNNVFKLKYCHTKMQKADGMTKPLPKGPLSEFRDIVVSTAVV